MGKQKKVSGNFLLGAVKKNLPWAVAPLVAAVIFFVFFQHYTGPESSMLQRTIFIFFALGGILAALGALIFGPWGLAGGYGMILIMTLPEALPDPWNRYFSFCYLALLLGGPYLYSLLQKKKAKAEPTPPAQSEVPEDIPSQGPIFVLHNLSGRVYQLVCRGSFLRAYRVGGELRGIYDGKLVDITNPRPLEKGDLEFPISEITLKIVPHGVYGITAKLRTEAKRWSCNPYITTTPEELEHFLCSLIPQARAPKKAPPVDSSRKALLQKLRTGLLIAIGVVNLPWMFLDVPYKLFSVAAMVLSLAAYGLCLAFPDCATLDDRKHMSPGRVDMSLPIAFSSIPLMLRTMTDFNFLDWPRLLLLSLVPAALVLAALLIRVEEVRRRPVVLILFLILTYGFGLGSAGQLNYLLNTAEPTAQSAVITDMDISTSSKGPDWYSLTVRTADGSQLELNTSKEHYHSLTVGDSVTVYIVPGGLGVPYAVATS